MEQSKFWISSTHFAYFGGLLVLAPMVVRYAITGVPPTIATLTWVDLCWAIFLTSSLLFYTFRRAQYLTEAINRIGNLDLDSIAFLRGIIKVECMYSKSSISPLTTQCLKKILFRSEDLAGPEMLVELQKISHHITPRAVNEVTKLYSSLVAELSCPTNSNT